MKNIKNWDKFLNELNRETYLSAADKLDTMGHKKRSIELKKHANINLKGYDDLGLFTFKNNFGKNGYFYGLELSMTRDMFADQKHEIEVDKSHNEWAISTIALFTDEEGKIFSPFWIDYNEEEDRVYIDKYDSEDGNEEPILFDNRKDAVKFIKALKSPQMKKDIDKIIDDEKLKELLGKMINNIKPNMLYR